MDSRVVHAHDGGVHQDEEDHHEKKSMMMKVKEKAKKIKDKMTHGYGHEEHDQQGGHISPGDHDLDVEDEKDSEGPEVHGATNAEISAPGQGDIFKEPVVKFGDTKAGHDLDAPKLERTDPMEEHVPGANQNTRQAHSVASGVMLMHDDVLDPRPADNNSGSAKGQEEIPGQQKVNSGRTSVMREGPHSPLNTPVSSFKEHKSNPTDLSHTFDSGKEGHLGQSRVNTDIPVSSLGDYETDVPDRSDRFLSGKEGHLGQSKENTNAAPDSSFGDHKSNVYDLDPTFNSGTEGHLGQSRENTNTPVSSLGEYKSKISDPIQTSLSGEEGQLGKSRDNLDRPRRLEEDSQAPEANPQAHTPSNYQAKVTDPTNAGGEEVGITPILHSFDKMNIDDENSFKMSSATSAIADKEISAKNAAASKHGDEGNNDQHGDDKSRASGGEEQKPHQNLPSTEINNPVSNLSTGSHEQFSAEKQTHPQDTTEKPSNQSSTYTEKVSSATSAIAGTAISAKNVVASKLGYGGNNDQHQEAAAKSGSAAPEQHGSGATGTAVGREAQQGATGGDYNKAGQDKGVSVKGYFAEKLKPGEEDKALSGLISETLHRPKAEHSGQPVAKVTESAEVTKQLGPDQGADSVEQSSYGKVVADTIRGAVGSLFGKGADKTDTSQQSLGSSTGTEGHSSSGSGVAEHRDHGVEQ